MKPANVEVTMGHDLGTSESYWKPIEREVLEDFLKAVPLLTINGDSMILQKQVEELTEKTNNNDYLLKAKLQERDNDINDLKAAVKFLIDKINAATISQPSTKVNSDQKDIPNGIEFTSTIGNAKASITK